MSSSSEINSPNAKYRGKNHQGDTRSTPYPTSRLAPATELVDLASAIAEADKTIQSHTNSKLDLIAKQIRNLQDEAHQILKQAQHDQKLHRADCNSTRLVGHTYYLYDKGHDHLYFSRLSPEDWQGNPPHVYKGAYRLEQDMSWTETEI